MIDIKLLRDNPDLIRASQRARGADEGVVETILSADRKRRTTLQEFEAQRSQQKSVSKNVGVAMGRLNAARKSQESTERIAELEQEAESARAQANDLSAQVKLLEQTAGAADREFEAALRTVANLVLEGVPEGGEENFVTLEQVGTPPTFAGDPLDHLALGEKLGAIDMERGAKVSGSRFYFLTGPGARLSQGLMALAQSVAADEGFVPMVVPTAVSALTMGGTGYLDAHDDVYHLAADDLYLTGTSEVALAGYHADELIDLSRGPIRYTATSTCYRREAGSYGKDTRGIFRVHQFTKTEMFVLCEPAQAVAEHENLLRIERRVLDALELPYRVIDVAAGDLGGSAARKFDCEAWVPTQGKYRELTSTSNCTTFQARRLNIRYKNADGRSEFAATLNGTVLTDTRPIVAVLENHQQPDGSVRVPQALQPFVGTDLLRPL